MEKHWMVIYTKARSEKKVEERLLQNNIEAYCPTFTTLKQWSDRKKKVILPLITSYVFVRVNEPERQKVLQDPGVMNFIYWQSKPAIVRENEITTLKAKTRNFIIPEAQVGDYLTIEQGAFKGQKGKVKHLKSNSIVIVLESLNMTIRMKK